MDLSHVQITTTTQTKEQAAALAQSLVEARLAACVQVGGPIASTYWWKGNLEHAEEWMCLIKTSGHLIDPLLKAVREQHPYENPEVTVTPIVGGSASYLAWIDEETLGDGHGKGASR